MVPEWWKLPGGGCVMENIRSQTAVSVTPHWQSQSSLSCQITFTSHIRTKAVWLKLEGHNWGIIHCFISARDGTITVYSNLAMHPCTLLANFKGFLWKKKKTNLPCPPPPQQITIQKSPSAQRHTTLSLLTDRASLDDWSRALWNFLSSPLWSKWMKAAG